MKIAILNTFDSGGGAARSAYRLHKGLLDQGIESVFVTQFNKGAGANIVCGRTRFDKVIALLRPLLDMIPMKLYRKRDHHQPFSTAYVPIRRHVSREIEKSDLLHLHWIVHGFLNIEYLAHVKLPIVWTLHDSWPFTGGCHLPGACTEYQKSCGKCPQLGSGMEHDLTRLNWSRKRRAWKGLNMVVVTPSNWLADCARKSSLFAGTQVVTIPNGIDIQAFKPADKNVCRNIIGLPPDVNIILFGAMGATTDKNKGFDLLREAMLKLTSQVIDKPSMLVVFGAVCPINLPDFNMEVRFLGTLADDISLSVLYSAADVMVVPSRQENLPNTIMEAMACGTPAVAFRTGGIPDLIDHRKSGYLAEPFDTDDLAEGIRWVLHKKDHSNEIGKLCRDKVMREFSLEVVSSNYIKLYSDLLQSSGQPD